MFDSAKMVEKINQLCSENNIKISDLEREVGLSKGNLSRWSKSYPSAIPTLYKIAEILNTSVDYLLDSKHHKRVGQGRSTILNQLLEQTESRGVVWKKISYSKYKKLGLYSCQNENVYNSTVSAYETTFVDKQLAFVCTNENCSLYIENNNEYFAICKNDSYTERLYDIIEELKQDVLNDFFNSTL